MRLRRSIIKSQLLRKIFFFFPIQLFFLHLQRNFILLVFWIILLLYITGNLGGFLGIGFLFLAPEYLGSVSFWSFLILGIAFGIFIMAFNISSYIINVKRFPFLATLSRPFTKYFFNNFIIPAIFLVYYCFKIYDFLQKNELYNVWEILGFIGALLLGIFVFLMLAFLYFFAFIKDIKKLFSTEELEKKKIKKEHIHKRHSPTMAKKRRLRRIFIAAGEWPVETYLRTPFSVSLARDADHYDQSIIFRVYQQNHTIAAIFELVTFALLIILGIFREVPALEIPTGASFFLLFTLLLMLASAIHLILRRWSTLFFISVFLIVNYLSSFPQFRITNYAYGLDYSYIVPYNPDSIQNYVKLHKPFSKDIKHHVSILEKWRQNAYVPPNSKKPRLIVLACSGGGLKASLWSFRCIQMADSLLSGKLLNNAHLIVGSSGGMIGAAYARELYRMKKLGVIDGFYNKKYANNIAKDLLNPVAASWVLNDLYLRLQSFEYNGETYTKDRAYAFEKELIENTNGALNKPLGSYKNAEANAKIPLMIFSPTIINDLKRLIISAQPSTFMCNNFPADGSTHPEIENIEYLSLFKSNSPLDIRFTTVIRMNATFPYVFPAVTLPTRPVIEIMDAGIRDNYGIRTAVQYLYHLREWINNNTSGVIIVKIHDSKKKDYKKNKFSSIVDRVFIPFRGLFGNYFRFHLQENAQLIQLLSEVYDKVPINVVEFRLSDILYSSSIPTSLHLTAKEKLKLMNAASSPKSINAVNEIGNLLNNR